MPLKDFFNKLLGSSEPASGPNSVATVPAGPPPAPPQQAAPNIAPVTEAASPAEATKTLPDTAPLSAPAARKATCGSIFCVGRASDVGRVRSHNEDAIFIFLSDQEGDGALAPFGLFILADGMGGHQAGEMASALACRVVAHYLLQNIYLPMLNGAERHSTQASLQDLIVAAITHANQEVARAFPGSGTTLTCGLLMGERLLVGHVGDSRAYLLREDKEPQLLTKDHSLVSRLVEMGQLTVEEAAVHPQRNVLYRAVGQGGPLDVDISTYPLSTGDRLLLCCDGLWGLLSETQLWQIIDEAPSPHAACEQLVQAANAAGGNDNISVVLAQIH